MHQKFIFDQIRMRVNQGRRLGMKSNVVLSFLFSNILLLFLFALPLGSNNSNIQFDMSASVKLLYVFYLPSQLFTWPTKTRKSPARYIGASYQFRKSVISVTLLGTGETDVKIGREHKMRGTSRLTDRGNKFEIRLIELILYFNIQNHAEIFLIMLRKK